MEFYKTQAYFNPRNQIFVQKPTYVMRVNENDTTFVPRFTLKDVDVFDDFPANTPTKFSQELILKAIEWGMIIQVDYKGEKDDRMEGHERTIYPMVLGTSKDGNLLLRGYHLNGWSVSKGGDVDKEWRMFRCDRILNMTFTGAFFRLAPDGYNMRDKGMTKIFGAADFEKIRRLQQKLLNANKIDSIDRVILKKIKQVEAKDIKYTLSLANPWKGNVIQKKDAKAIRITFAKPIVGGGKWIALIGTSIEPNNIFKMTVDNTLIGSYKSVKWIMASQLNVQGNVNNQTDFKAYMFVKGS